MKIERNITSFVARSDESVRTSLQRISDNRSGVVFVVDENGLLQGVLTDGDFRRWIVSDGEAVSLDAPVLDAANKHFVAIAATADAQRIEELLDNRVAYLPLLDDRGRLVAVATRRERNVFLGSHEIADDKPTLVIAEIGINHDGDVERAFELVRIAGDAGANCAKFQMRDLASLYRTSSAGEASEDLGSQYIREVLDASQLSVEEMYKVFDFCAELGLLPLCTPFDVASVEALDRYQIPAYKTASADLTNHDLLRACAQTGRPLLVSTGMSAEAEIVDAVELLRSFGSQFVLLHCNSTYPAPFKDIHLRYLDRLREIAGNPVGYSGHERGTAVSIAAVAMGARVIERHLTTDRTLPGGDHRMSLLPEEFARMVEGIRQVEDALGVNAERVMTQGESMNRVTLAKSLVARRALPAGTVVSDADIDVKSPGRGLQPNRRDELVGCTLRRHVAEGDFFFAGDLSDEPIQARPYSFARPWGVPVRYHDYRQLASRSNPDFLEFHLSYRDMDLALTDFFDEPLDLDLVVHSPDLFRDDHILNFASDNEDYLRRSRAELQRVIDVTRELQQWFSRATRPKIVVSLGGFSKDHFLPPQARKALYERVAEGLDTLDAAGVEILPQTLPPFPWYMGGQLYCNLFVDADDTAEFCENFGYRICLDVSHSKLATNLRRGSFRDFVDRVHDRIGHLHVVDARGVDGEGLQIGDGEIDFAVLASQLADLSPDVGFIPEIWQGHVNDGEPFWIALDRLEQWFGVRQTSATGTK